jgi:polyferredoxin
VKNAKKILKKRKKRRGGSLRPLILVLSLVLGLVPLVGVAWIFVSGMITLSPPSATVDGLFMTLILLTLSACFLLNAYWEMRDRGMLGKKATEPAKAPTAKAS